jgi:hypothetical protein
MAKSMENDPFDAMLNYIKNNSTRLCVCNAQPTTYTQAITTYKLAIKTISSTDFTGPADGDTNGRKITANQQSGITVDASGDATHVALADSVGTKLVLVTTCTTQALTSGNTVTVPAFDDEVADPT